MSENSKFKLNQRIQVGDDRGTILYIGQVNRIKGEVLGIEWDNIERGKHSGNFEGIQYFTTIKPNSGSFLKQSTLTHCNTIPTSNTKEYSLGTDLFNSIILKYATFDTQQGEVKLNNSSRVVEAIGFEESFNRQKQVENLKVISLLGYCISKIDNNENLKTLTSLEDLNLSSNLLNSWSTISEIITQLINLTTLNLSDNLFTPLTEPLINQNFINLKILYLNKTKINWEQYIS
ncbi:hypothetical protein CONCODRAFT_171085 [Conidiobolus coronatus NRRL 28638]|uniref:CAP-Gly domain-containing protein n=1 Tax=Conidiobolus coronatus (strain ATCC 28846 / CBS 209.66 / NRRL 28638) TaxID=796925 RepID=A0A137P4X9_CONC2|nr:hypothetical protein CONCODRAFT_171085 [Conidiobolus coronatus NRRL 28638]|eukprot:KXN70070.1 hypothetical protein CONCODRAFT_171085 [Conidiobolus coronatus NRRL 28638]